MRMHSLPRGFGWLISTQAASALADHALLIVAIALLHRQGLPPWWAPLLKLAFTLAYVVLRPSSARWPTRCRKRG